MNRRNLLLILAALLVALLIGLIWFFFFKNANPLPTAPGTFGTGNNRPSGTTGGNGRNNIPNSVPTTNTGTNQNQTGTTNTGTSGSTNVGSIDPLTGLPLSAVDGLQSIPGVDWLGGSGGTPGQTSTFVPRTTNQLNSGNVSGSPSILPTPGAAPGPEGEGSILGPALAVAGIGTALCTVGLLPGALAGTAAASAAVGAPGVPSADIGTRLQGVLTVGSLTNDQIKNNFLDCMTRNVARVALNQITASIVNWINSGFNGQPSFVKNYKQFFTNVADAAAGEYIRGSGLAFLCTPFRNQIRVALAQSYARRGAQSCTLSGVVKNINAFTGNFNQGGWAGMLSFTGTPTNNPFGAFSFAQTGLANAQQSALSQKQQDYTLGRGFLSSTKEVCTGPIDLATGKKTGCKTQIVTPGSTIAESLNKTLGVGQDSLNLAKNFDEIISALITQLMVKTLQNGLSNLSGTQGYAADYLTPEQQKAQQDAQTLITNLQNFVNLSQQYGTIKQGSINDIQNTQNILQELVNCYEVRNQAERATSTAAILYSYNSQIDALNSDITKANESISLLQDLQTDAISVATPADVAAVVAAYNSANARGLFVTQADVTNAQQDRTTLQAALTARNNSTNTELSQCNAL